MNSSWIYKLRASSPYIAHEIYQHKINVQLDIENILSVMKRPRQERETLVHSSKPKFFQFFNPSLVIS